MPESMVQIRNVTKVYERGKQKIEVLHGLTLEIPRGDFVALMGPSGSGKTTLLNLIGGLDQPTSGEIAVGGRRIDQLSSGQLAQWRAHHVGRRQKAAPLRRPLHHAGKGRQVAERTTGVRFQVGR